MSLIGWWPLNNNTKDHTVNRNDGIANNITWESGKIGKAGKFNGSNSSIRLNDSILVGKTEGSVSAWIYLSADQVDHATIFASQTGPAWNNMRLNFSSNGARKIKLTISTGSSSTTTSCTISSNLELNIWYHIVGTYNGSKIKLYLNGTLNKEINSTLTPGEYTPLYTGIGYMNYSNRYWNGLINDVRLYDHSLSQKEINDLYKINIRHYSFDKDESTIYDNSGFEYHSLNQYNISFGSDEKFSKYLTLNGSNSYIEIPKYDLTVGSLSVWVKTDRTKNQILIGDYNSIGMGFYTGNLISAIGPLTKPLGNLAASTSKWVNNEWNHIVITADESGTHRHYCNGELLGTTSSNNWGWVNTSTAFIGRRNPGSSSVAYYFDGGVADLKLYPIVLSSEEIKNMYQTKISLDKEGNLYLEELIEDIRPNVYDPISVDLYNESSNIPDEDGFYITTGGYYSGYIFNKAALENGKTYKISFTYKSINGNVGWYTIANPGSALSGISYGSNKSLNLNGDGQIRQHSFEITATKDHEVSVCLLRNGTQSGNVGYKDLKVIDTTSLDIVPVNVNFDKSIFYKTGKIITNEFIEDNNIDKKMKIHKDQIKIRGTLNEK